MKRSFLKQVFLASVIAAPVLTLSAAALCQGEKHGALAYSESSHHYGWAHDQSSAGAAEQAANAACGAGCTVRIAWHNGCAAYAEGAQNTHYGWSLGTSASDAKEKALAACSRGGAHGCTVRVFACNNN